MYLKNKPTPLGIGAKTLACAASGIMLNWELLEGKQVDARKAHVVEFGLSTATTIRLQQLWEGTFRTVVADSWFGSYCCAHAVRERGTLSVMNVKSAHKQYPKEFLKGQVAVRGDQYHMAVQIEGEEYPVWASVHKDRAPMCLVHTTGGSDEGTSRTRLHRYFDR